MSRGSCVVALAFVVCAATAQAQVARVFVSVTGNDANVCSDVFTPCRTLAGGIAQVDVQGEVIVIASGSYAGGTITKSVRIDVAAGVVAFSGLPITVDPGAGGTVVLRGLTLKAATPGVGNGITQQSGTLFVENTVVDGWGFAGLSAEAGAERLFVKQSVFRNQVSNGLVTQLSSFVDYAIDHSFFENNGSIGVAIFGGRGRVSNNVMTRNQYGAWVSSPGVEASFQRCEVSVNADAGLRVANGATLRVSESAIAGNAIGLENFVSGSLATLERFGNNAIRGNTTNLSGTIVAVPLQ